MTTMDEVDWTILKAVRRVQDDGKHDPMQARAVIDDPALSHMSVGDRWRAVERLIVETLLYGHGPWPIDFDGVGAYPSYDGLSLTKLGRDLLDEADELDEDATTDDESK